MRKYPSILLALLVMTMLLDVDCKRSFSWGGGGKKSLGTRRGSSRGSSSTSGSSSSTSSGGWFFTKTSNTPSAPPQPKQSSGSGGWVNPSQHKVNQPSSNIGPGGYPVQQGYQNVKPPPYPAQGGVSNSKPYPVQPPPYSQQVPTGHSSFNPNTRINPPAYSPHNPYGSPPAYSAPKKVVVNNHYHYGGSSGGYQSSGFGYPGGGLFSGGHKPSYNGMGLFSSGHGSYGYPGGGSWGMPSYGRGSSGSGGMVKGLLIGAAGGYLASSLIRRVTNPWGYGGSGYGHGYMSGYSDYMRHQAIMNATPAPAAAVDQSGNDWISCVAFDPSTNSTLINPNCTCTVTVITDPNTGLNQSYHDCTPYGVTTPSPMIRVPQAPQAPGYGVNNPPPSFDSGSMYGSGTAYGGYGGSGYPAPVQGEPSYQAPQGSLNVSPPEVTDMAEVTAGSDSSVVVPSSEAPAA